MAAPTPTNRPNPEHIFNTLSAYQQSAALKAGIELDVFTAIADGANTSATGRGGLQPGDARENRCRGCLYVLPV
jgi:hypothetical protein